MWKLSKNIQNEDRLQQEAFERVKKIRKILGQNNNKSPLYSSIPNTFDAVKEKEV